jgi:hypothetical protein
VSDAKLEALAVELRAENPALVFVVDTGTVWLRHEGTDYGVYSRVVGGAEVVKVMEGRTSYVTRPTPEGATR